MDSDTSINFKVPTEDLALFSKKLYPLAKTDRNSVLAFFVQEDKVVIRFRVNIDGSGAEAVFEHILHNAEIKTKGQLSVYSNDFAEVINKYPQFKAKDKPHTKTLHFIGKPGSLKVKTDIFWNADSKPTAQQININTVRTPEELVTTPLDIESIDQGVVEIDNVAASQAIDMCSFIRGDVTSKDDQGYWFSREGENLIILATDLMVASRQTLTIFKGDSEVNGIISRQILNAVKIFTNGEDPIHIRTFKRLVYLRCGPSRMIAPTMRTKFPLDSSIFYSDNYLLASVDIGPLVHILSHFLVIDKHPYHKTTIEFDALQKTFKVTAGTDSSNNVDNLPSEVSGTGKFDVDASYFYAVLSRMKKAGQYCKIYLDKETSEKITLISGNEEVRYLIQGLSPEYGA